MMCEGVSEAGKWGGVKVGGAVVRSYSLRPPLRHRGGTPVLMSSEAAA
jgi:hypothetical protein